MHKLHDSRHIFPLCVSIVAIKWHQLQATSMGLPITCADIINLPMDEFNDLLSKHELTEEQLTLCRDIRRRGKNKVAAQNSRKRQDDQVSCDWWSRGRDAEL